MAGQINIKFQVDLATFSTAVDNMARQLDKVGKKLQSIGDGMTTFITLPVLAAGAAAIKFSSDYEESLNKVNVAFDTSSESVKKFAKNSLESFGIAEGSALDMSATFGDMATSMGLSRSASAKMATSLTGLAGDLASFKNISIEESVTALNGVFTGETESLKRLGIVMTEAALQTFALNKGIKTQVKDMSQAEKVNLRYAYVMEASKNAQGDFARTGGGAANQMRIFQESLKQLAQQFGSVILPTFTKVIKFVNDKIKAFSNLSDGTKVLVISLAGLAAATGPVLSGLGRILTFIPNMTGAFKLLATQWNSFVALIAANPYTAAAIGIAALVGGLVAYFSSSKKAVEQRKIENEVMSEANAIYNEQKLKVETLLATAKNENLSKQERIKALKELNKIAPEYFNNLTLETVNTNKTTEAVRKYNEALLQGAKAKAAQNLLQEETQKFLKTQLFLENKISAAKSARPTSETVDAKSFDEAVKGFNKVDKKKKEFYQNNSQFIEKSIKEDEAAAKANEKAYQSRVGYLTGVIQSGEKYKGLIKEETDAKIGLSEINDKLKTDEIINPDSVAFLEKIKSSLEDQQKRLATTNTEWLSYQDRINEVSLAIEKLTNIAEPVKAIDLPKINSVDFIDPQIRELESLRNSVALTSAQYQAFGAQIKALEAQKLRIINPEQIIQDNAVIQQAIANLNATGANFLASQKQQSDEFIAKKQSEVDALQVIGSSMVDAFGSISQGFVDQLGIADQGMKSFVSGLVSTITKLIAMALSASMANSIQGATQSGSATGPAAVFTTPAFIATAIAGIIGAFASIPRFESGGIMGGSSYFGDKLLARINSGELILNGKQQSTLYGMLNQSVVNPEIQLVGGLKLSGSDLELILERTKRNNSRTR